MIKAKTQELAEMRVSNGWTGTHLAKQAGLHQTEVSRAQRGKRISPRVAKAIADAFGVAVTDLFLVCLKRELG